MRLSWAVLGCCCSRWPCGTPHRRGRLIYEAQAAVNPFSEKKLSWISRLSEWFYFTVILPSAWPPAMRPLHCAAKGGFHMKCSIRAATFGALTLAATAATEG